MYSFLFEYEPIYRSLKRLTSIKRQDKRVWLTIIYLFLFEKKYLELNKVSQVIFLNNFLVEKHPKLCL